MILGGVAAALLGAVALAFGAQLQNRGVGDARQGQEGGFGVRRLLGLLRQRRWLLGTGLLTLAVLLQLVGLLLAPLPVVQPLGVLSLVVTALLTRRLEHARLQRRGVQGIAVCVVGVSGFVVAAALETRSAPAGVGAVVPVLVLAGFVLLALLAVVLVRRGRMPALAAALSGGVCFGFVVTLMKALLDRVSASVQQGSLTDQSTPFTVLLLAGAGAAGLAGITLVQAAYSEGSTGLVVAALTVIDPLVAVALSIGLLGAAAGAPLWVLPVLAVTQLLAIAGVVLMAMHPPVPETSRSDRVSGSDRTGRSDRIGPSGPISRSDR